MTLIKTQFAPTDSVKLAVPSGSNNKNNAAQSDPALDGFDQFVGNQNNLSKGNSKNGKAEKPGPANTKKDEEKKAAKDNESEAPTWDIEADMDLETFEPEEGLPDIQNHMGVDASGKSDTNSSSEKPNEGGKKKPAAEEPKPNDIGSSMTFGLS